MIYRIRNSKFSMCLQAVLICYFIISSINLSGYSGGRTLYTDIHKSENTFGLILKKIFKCDNSAEEFDDFETKNAGKNLWASDYLVPGHTWLLSLQNFTKLKGKLHGAKADLVCSFYRKINLPPPEQYL